MGVRGSSPGKRAYCFIYVFRMCFDWFGVLVLRWFLFLFLRPNFEYRDIGVQVGGGASGHFCDDVQEFRALMGVYGLRDAGVQVLRG
jgi:hypothetical protein